MNESEVKNEKSSFQNSIIGALFEFGSTFWIDSLVCVGLGSAMVSNLNEFYGVYETHLDSHVGGWQHAQKISING